MDKLINTVDALEMKIAKLEEKIDCLETDSEKSPTKPKHRVKASKTKKQG